MDSERRAIRVCFVTGGYPPQVGGLGASAERLVGYLIEAGFAVHVVTPVPQEIPATIPPALEGGAWIYRVGIAPTNPLEGLQALATAIWELDRSHHFDLFHGFYLTAAYPCLLAIGRTARPLIVSLRGSDIVRDIEEPRYRPFLTRALQKATWITAVNTGFLDRAARYTDLAGRASVIANAVPPPADPTWQLGDRNRGVAGTVSLLRYVKNIPLLIEAYAHVCPDLRRRLLLVGYWSDSTPIDVADRIQAEAIIERQGIGAEVEITGAVTPLAVSDYLRAMHVFVLSSRYEGMSNALLEALAFGVPVVTTSIANMEHVARSGENLLHVPNADAREIGAAIAAILADDQLAARLSAGGRACAARFDTQTEKEGWLAVYRHVLAH